MGMNDPLFPPPAHTRPGKDMTELREIPATEKQGSKQQADPTSAQGSGTWHGGSRPVRGRDEGGEGHGARNPTKLTIKCRYNLIAVGGC